MSVQKKRFSHVIANAVIIVILVVDLLPLVIVFSSSLKDPDSGESPIRLFTQFTLKSYMLAVEKMNFITSFFNSVVITVVSVALIVIFTSMAAYAIVRINTKISSALLRYFLSGMIVSAQMSVIPMFVIIKGIGLSNSRIAPILLYATSSIAFSVFLYHNFIKSGVPVTIEESAYMDGAGNFRIFWQIVFPLILPATAAVVITQGIYVWNDFFLSMLFLSDPAKKTLPLVMLNFVGDMENPTQWNMLFAACVLCSLPLIVMFSFLQKYFIGGLTVGAVKG